MESKVRKAIEELHDAHGTIAVIWEKVYNALSKVYPADDVPKIMNGGYTDVSGGYMRTEQDMNVEIRKLISALDRANLGDEEKKV